MKHKAVNVILKCFDLNDLNNVSFLKYRSVTNLNNLLLYVEKSYKIDYINIYDHSTKEKIKGISYKSYKGI